MRITNIHRRFLIATSIAMALAVSSMGQSVLADTVATNTGAATTKTEILAGKNVAPMLSEGSALALRQAEERYGEIAASGGWPLVKKTGLKKGAIGDAVAVLNKRLFIEGYLRVEATQGEFASIFTTATQDALARFQRNNGLAITGQVDSPTLATLNISAKERLRTIRENIPRLEIYSIDLGSRYLLVNVPSQQIESVNNGRVYSRHNAIVGRPERPTPVVMTALSEVKFNPYWNAPASIVERDIIPKLQNSTQVLEDMNIKIFEGVGGPEVDPTTVDWDTAIADNYHFRQEPGPGNAMATAKVEFLSPFGIYLHDTPEKQLFKSGRRFFSSGCVRVEHVEILLNWILNGQDGYNDAKISAMAETLERLDVPLVSPPQLRVMYLTAWPVGNTVAFRPDVYDLDGTEFTVGQPMPVGETSPEGLRYTLKPIPRLVAQVDSGSESGGLFSGFFGKRKVGAAKNISDSNTGSKNKKQTGGLFVNDAFAEDTDAAAKKPTAKKSEKSSVGFFDWATYRKQQKNKPKEPVLAAKVKPAKTKPAVAVDTKKLVAKPATAKVAPASTKADDAVVKKTTIAKAPAKPVDTAKNQVASKPTVSNSKAVDVKVKDKKPAAKLDCKPDKVGKLPEGCPAAPKPKTAKVDVPAPKTP
jgi:peptidoglycan hydrolase-like protein with peptidoglycan-binding domain